jgi:hypothetical protein
MHPRHAFCSPARGLKHGIEVFQMALAEYFKLLWMEDIQKKIVHESNRIARSLDPQTGVPVEGRKVVKPITVAEFKKWMGIMILMGVGHQPCMRDYWRLADDILYCKDIANQCCAIDLSTSSAACTWWITLHTSQTNQTPGGTRLGR